MWPLLQSVSLFSVLLLKGALPLACYPDIGPFGNIIPLEAILSASRSYGGGDSRGGLSGSQAYRLSLRDSNKKDCSGQSGICRNEGGKLTRW
jgi:hypothetical protein